MVFYCADLTLVYSFTIGKFVFTSMSASVCFSSFVLKVASFICYAPISYLSFKHKRQCLLLGLLEGLILTSLPQSPVCKENCISQDKSS